MIEPEPADVALRAFNMPYALLAKSKTRGLRPLRSTYLFTIDLRRLVSQVRFEREREEVPTQPDDSVSRRVHPNHTFKQNGEGFPGDDELGEIGAFPGTWANATTSTVPPG